MFGIAKGNFVTIVKCGYFVVIGLVFWYPCYDFQNGIQYYLKSKKYWINSTLTKYQGKLKKK